MSLRVVPPGRGTRASGSCPPTSLLDLLTIDFAAHMTPAFSQWLWISFTGQSSPSSSSSTGFRLRVQLILGPRGAIVAFTMGFGSILLCGSWASLHHWCLACSCATVRRAALSITGLACVLKSDSWSKQSHAAHTYMDVLQRGSRGRESLSTYNSGHMMPGRGAFAVECISCSTSR